MAHFTLTELAHEEYIPEKTDIIVIGAGMAGLYTTWRILQEYPQQKIFIFDKLDRTGGRLDSDLIHFKNQVVKEEEGGMRFTFDTMDNLMSLFLILGLEDQIVPFPMNSGGNNRLYFRGHSFTNQDAQKNEYSIWEELYHLESAERGVDPKSVIDTVFNRILAVNPDFTERPDNRNPEFWQKFRLECQWNGVKLKDWTLWNLFMEMGYSNEFVTLLYRLLGFNGTFLSEMNAGVAYQLLEDFPSEPDFKTLKDGFSILPNALAEKVGKERIFLDTTLESIEKTEEEGYTLKYSTINKQGTVVRGVLQTQKIILALPRLALEKLFINSDALNKLGNDSKKIWNTLQTTSNQALLKINLYYDKAWWGNNITGQPPVAYGPSFSDLPLGSVYPFYSIDEEAFAALEYEKWLESQGKEIPESLKAKLKEIDNKKYGLPAALTIYCDYMNINFWKALQNNGALFTSPMQEEYTQEKRQTLYAASEAVVREATEFFKVLFNTHYVPRPVMTSTRIWDGSTRFDEKPSEQFGFGVHQWALNADDKQVMADLTEPLKNIYTCGEAYSDYQGWVEGALRSANLVLEQGFNIKPISEVYQQEKGVSPSDAIKKNYQEQSIKMIRKYIDPDFNPNIENEHSRIQNRDAWAAKPFSVSLTYFDHK